MGIIEDSERDDTESEHEQGEAEQEELETAKNLSEVDRMPLDIKWSPDGKAFAILYRRMAEVYDLMQSDDKPVNRNVFDHVAVSFDWLSDDKLVVADVTGSLLMIKKAREQEVHLAIYRTKFSKVTQLRCFEDTFIAAIVHDSGEGKLVMWAATTISEAEDLAELKADLVLKCGIGRLTALNV